MTIYVGLPSIPLTLKFEESLGDVVEHFRGLLEEGSVHRYEVGEGEMVLVNYGVMPCLTFREGARTLEVSELNRGLAAKIS